MGYKLSILPGDCDQTGWHQTNQFKLEEIQRIKVDGAGVNRSLNAIPTPFARMHLVETAFQMVYQDLVHQTNLAGETYNRLVSDCLDVFELIYHWDAHLQESRRLEFVTWDRESEIDGLLKSGNKSHILLGKTFQTFLDSDPNFDDYDKCLMIKYKDKVIAGSSPFTGFFTTPDSLVGFDLLKPLTPYYYFSRTIPFSERKDEIQRYIYDFFERNDRLKKNPATSAMRDLLERYKTTIPNVKLSLRPIHADRMEVNCFDRSLQTAEGIGTEYFEKYIVRLNDRLNEECFYLPRNANVRRTHDYLLPLSAAFFKQFSPEQIPDIVTFTERDGSVEVAVGIPGGKKVSKKYVENHVFDQDGQILDLYEKHQINFNLGIFPFLKVTGQAEGAEGFNDFYRVVTMIEDLNHLYSNKDFTLQFGKDRQLLKNGDLITISRTERTIFSDKTDMGSTFHAINSCFDFIQLGFPVLEAGKPVNAMLAIKWKEKVIGNKQMDFAVDLGTTFTFIAFTDDPAHNKPPRPFEFDEKELPVALLHKADIRPSGSSSMIEFMESASKFPMSIEVQRQEFIPSIIRRKDKYRFPVRTVLFQQQSIPAGQKNVLANANISFVYQHPKNSNRNFGNQEYQTNLKWNIGSISDFKGSIEVFIEEIILLIRTKILLNEGDPRKSRIYWFYPLSFTSILKSSYTGIWQQNAEKYLKPISKNVFSLTESEAPYHFLSKGSDIHNSMTVVTMDIGGGSTDIMVFNGDKPAFGTSVYFGANVLWGNGYGFPERKINGIYLDIRQEMAERLKSTMLKKTNEDYNADSNANVGSDEIINFWITNHEETHILNRLKSGDFKLSYLLHLSALVYGTLKLMRSNPSGLNPKWPTCVVFSGNGSRYIDLVDNTPAIERIWGYFARKIFGPDAIDPQVILPREDRKEATCYGGLSMSSQPAPIVTKNYLGFEKDDDKQQFTYNYLATNKDEIFTKLLQSFTEFIEWFFEMNQVRELNFRSEFGIQKKLEPFKRFLLERAAENLHEGYLKRSKLISPDDQVTDSLFFYPLVGLIFKINKLTEKELYDLTEKTVLYAPKATGEQEFDPARLTSEQRRDSIFTLTVENNNPDFALLSIINEPEVHKRILQIHHDYLDPVCTYSSHPEPGQSIRVTAPGKARRQGDKWFVEQKIQIEFV